MLVHDGAIDQSHAVIEDLVKKHPFITAIWLSRNYGQHPATLAGMAGTTGDWVVTLDEDGQHDPKEVGRLLDARFLPASRCRITSATNVDSRAPITSLRQLRS